MIQFSIEVEALTTTIEGLPPKIAPYRGPGSAAIDLMTMLQYYLKSERGLVVGALTADAVLRQLGSASDDVAMEIQGRDLTKGLPRVVTLKRSEVWGAIYRVMDNLVRAVSSYIKRALEDVEASEEVQITLAGDYARVFNLDKRLSESIGLPVVVVETEVAPPTGQFRISVDALTTSIDSIGPDGQPHLNSVSLGAIHLIDAILDNLNKKYRLLVGRRTAEFALHDLGSRQGVWTTTVRGRNLISGLPEAREISSIEIAEAIADVMDQLIWQISGSIERALEHVEPGSVDQITLGGEFARVFDLDKRLSESIGLPVEVEE